MPLSTKRIEICRDWTDFAPYCSKDYLSAGFGFHDILGKPGKRVLCVNEGLLGKNVAGLEIIDIEPDTFNSWVETRKAVLASKHQ